MTREDGEAGAVFMISIKTLSNPKIDEAEFLGKSMRLTQRPRYIFENFTYMREGRNKVGLHDNSNDESFRKINNDEFPGRA